MSNSKKRYELWENNRKAMVDPPLKKEDQRRLDQIFVDMQKLVDNFFSKKY